MELGIRNSPKIAALRKEEAQEPIGIFIGASLPGLVRLSKVDRSSQSLFQALKVSELRTIIEADALYWKPTQQCLNDSAGLF